eukprot:TRINITY_DN237_c0_g1_i2.p2 TRINITY_DN237_c0_g1~~TRINITY_DN237_c0_g1_i2.p2  ORF type:complete len:495 (+),score=142.11 TRINITY_DN237_c0_g1_i2:78-1487(+)
MLLGPPAMLLGRPAKLLALPAKLVGHVAQLLLAGAAECKKDFAEMSRRELALYALTGAVYIAALPKLIAIWRIAKHRRAMRSMQMHPEGVDSVAGMGDKDSGVGFNLMLPPNWVCVPHPFGPDQEPDGFHCMYVLGHRQVVDQLLKDPDAHGIQKSVILLHLRMPGPKTPSRLVDFIIRWHIPVMSSDNTALGYGWVQAVAPSVCNRVQGNHRFWAWELRMGYHSIPAEAGGPPEDDASAHCSSPSLSEHGSAPPEPDPERRPEHGAHWFTDHDGVPHSGVAGGSLVDGLPLLAPATFGPMGQPPSSPGDLGNADTAGGQVIEHVWYLGTEGCGLFWYFQVEGWSCYSQAFIERAQLAQHIASTLKMVKSSNYDSWLKGSRRTFRKVDKDLPLKAATDDRNFELVAIPPPGLPPAKPGPLWGAMRVTVRHRNFKSHLHLRVHPEATVGEVASLAAKELQTTQCSCSDCP